MTEESQIEFFLNRLFHYYTPGPTNFIVEPGLQFVTIDFGEFTFDRFRAIPSDPCLGGGSPQSRLILDVSCCNRRRHLTGILQKKLNHKWVTIEIAEHIVLFDRTFSIHGAKEIQQSNCGEFPLASDVLTKDDWIASLNAIESYFNDFIPIPEDEINLLGSPVDFIDLLFGDSLLCPTTIEFECPSGADPSLQIAIGVDYQPFDVWFGFDLDPADLIEFTVNPILWISENFLLLLAAIAIFSVVNWTSIVEIQPGLWLVETTLTSPEPGDLSGCPKGFYKTLTIFIGFCPGCPEGTISCNGKCVPPCPGGGCPDPLFGCNPPPPPPGSPWVFDPYGPPPGPNPAPIAEPLDVIKLPSPTLVPFPYCTLTVSVFEQVFPKIPPGHSVWFPVPTNRYSVLRDPADGARIKMCDTDTGEFFDSWIGYIFPSDTRLPPVGTFDVSEFNIGFYAIAGQSRNNSGPLYWLPQGYVYTSCVDEVCGFWTFSIWITYPFPEDNIVGAALWLASFGLDYLLGTQTFMQRFSVTFVGKSSDSPPSVFDVPGSSNKEVRFNSTCPDTKLLKETIPLFALQGVADPIVTFTPFIYG